MKEINFRIVELEQDQVLISKDFDNDEDENSYQCVMTVMIDGVKVEQKIGCKSEESRDKIFNGLTDAQCQSFADEVKSMME